MQIKALVIETAYPGDVVISLALAHALKQCNSEAHITYLVRPDAVELTQCSPHVDEVISFDKRGLESGLAGLIRKSEELNTKGFTHVFVLQNSRRNLALVKRLTVPHKVGFGEESSVSTSCLP
jgi:heptosyltransferase II